MKLLMKVRSFSLLPFDNISCFSYHDNKFEFSNGNNEVNNKKYHIPKEDIEGFEIYDKDFEEIELPQERLDILEYI